MKKLTTIILHSSFFIFHLAAVAAVPLRWTVETNRIQPAQFEAYHGEALEFEATFNSLGKPLALDSHTATLYYQTNGMDQAWWSFPASVSGNVARAVFTPAMDPAAKQITVFLGVSAGPSNQNYRASASVRFRNSPGAAPGWIEPPVVKLDFSTIETLNAPWFTKDESNDRFPVKSAVYTKTETDAALSDKQDTISDLASIRSGAALGATAVQPSAISDMETKTHAAATYQPKGSYLTSESDPTVATKISNHNSSSTAHLDIRQALVYKYSKPTAGIPKTDLSSEVQTSLGKADTALQQQDIFFKLDKRGDEMTGLLDAQEGIAARRIHIYGTEKDELLKFSWGGGTSVFSGFDFTLLNRVKLELPWNKPAGNYTIATTSDIPTDATVSGWGYIKSYSESDPTVDGKIATAISGKQDTISDLATIRSGAAAGATAVQPSAISDMETQTHAAQTYQPKGSYLTSESDPTVDAKLAPIETTVSAWQTYWDGDDVRVTVTNYYGSQDLPSLYIEQKISDGGTNYYKTIWTEKARLNVILDRLLQIESDIATKADRAWGFYDSHSGTYAPDGFASISSESILISKDMSYQKTVTSGGEVWVLTATDPTVVTGTATNGFFRITDSEGNSVFEVVKGDKRTVPATVSEVSAGGNSLTINYNVVSSEHPSLEICSDLVDADWKAEDDASCPATVVWSGTSGNYVATVTGKAAMPKMFVKGTYEVGGETYARHGVPLGFDRVVIGGVFYRVAVETVSGKKLMTLTEL